LLIVFAANLKYGDERRGKQADKDEKKPGRPGKNTMLEQGLIGNKPVVRTFPRFLQDLGDTVFIFFNSTNDGEVVAGGVTYADAASAVGKLVVNTAG